MLLRLKKLMDTIIIDLEKGRNLARICDIIFTPGRKKILGFSVDCNKWVKKEKFIFIKDIINIGRDAVTIGSDEVLHDIDKYPEVLQVKNERNRLMGLKVVTTAGDDLGIIEDLIIDEIEFNIEGYVLTDGIIEDIINGKSILLFDDEMIFGEDVVLVNVNNKAHILRNEISIKKVFRRQETSI